MNRWSSMTDKIRAKLPHWWRMRRDQDSLGAQFLNVFGLTFEDVKNALDYVRNQYYIGTADVRQADVVYKTTIPSSVTSNSRIRLTGLSYLLETVPDMNTFLTGMSTDGLAYQELYYNNPYYIDWTKNLLYVRKPYQVTSGYPEGSVVLEVLDSNNLTILQQTMQLHIHHIWNFFDEFGLLLDTPRIYGEKNDAYVDRILDVFRHPSNSSRRGLINGIGRDLSLTHRESWDNNQFDHILYPPRVILESLEVDGKPWPVAQTTTDNSGRIVLLGSPTADGLLHMISYVAGLDIHRLGDKMDYAFQNQLYTPQGTATPLLQYYVDIITKNVPVMWGRLVYGVGHWDVTSADLSGTGFMPAILDANFMAWSTYVPKG